MAETLGLVDDDDDELELFFALVAPSGCDLDSVVDALRNELCAVGYKRTNDSKSTWMPATESERNSLRGMNGDEKAIPIRTPRSSAKMAFRPFMGLAPKGFMVYFEHGRRKNRGGYAMRWNPSSSRPRRTGSHRNELSLKKEILCDRLQQILHQKELANEQKQPTRAQEDTARGT